MANQGAAEVAAATDQGALAALLDPEHPIKVATREWAQAELSAEGLVQRDADCSFDAEGWRRCAEHGILGMVVPEEHGGSGADIISTLLTLEGLGYGSPDFGLAFAASATMWATMLTLVDFASDEQKAKWLPAMCRGERYGCFSMVEPESGSDAFSLSTTARKEGDNYVLNGTKTWTTMAPVADVAIVFATIDPALGRWGITAFLIERDMPGVTFGPNRPKMGLRTAPFGDIVLDNCVVPESARIGAEGSGGAMFTEAMAVERGYLMAVELGAMERQIDETIAFVRGRKQFGKPIGDFQAVAHRVVDMVARYETSRLLLYKTALLDMAGHDTAKTAALTNFWVTEAATASGVDAIVLNGAHGYLRESGVEGRLRDAVGGLIYSGTSDIQRNTVARLLGMGSR